MENDKARRKHLLDNFKLTIEDWAKVEAYQKGVCWVCQKKNKSGKRLSTDHQHSGDKPGLFRGLLCASCNRVLGKIEDPRWQWTPDLLRRAADYLQYPPAVLALQREHIGYPGRVGTKAHRRLLKRALKQQKKRAPIPTALG